MNRNDQIRLCLYKVKDVPLNYSLGKANVILDFRYKYENNLYLLNVKLDIANVITTSLYDLDEKTLLSQIEHGENVFYVFNRLDVKVWEIEEYAKKLIEEHANRILRKRKERLQ